jgi:hypothetical protein
VATRRATEGNMREAIIEPEFKLFNIGHFGRVWVGPKMTLTKEVDRTVRNGTAPLLPLCDHGSMPHKKTRNKANNSTRASVTREMAKPRMAKSARVTELNLDTARLREHPTAIMPGSVDKIIPPRPSHLEKAQIGVDGADRRYRDLRIENTLTDEHGDDVRLKKGDRVELTITAEPKR